MTVITVAYPQLGFNYFNKNTIAPSNYTQRLHFSSRFTKPSSKITVITSNSDISIEKESEFKPSFDEYLKAMETVKIRREKRLTSPLPLSSPSSEIDEEKIELSGNKKWVRKKLEFKDEIEVGVKKDDEFQEKGFNMKRVLSNPKEGEVMKKWTRKNSDFENAQIDIKVQEQDEVMKKWTRKKSDFENAQMDIKVQEQDEFMKKWTRKKSDFENAQMDIKVQEQDEVMKKWARKKTDTNGFQEQSFKVSNVMNKERVVYVKKPSAKYEHSNHDKMEIERGAFKSLEDSQDVCDQPRVSRVDMEERIQRLAKCLNGASIDTPEWNFSKMMRSAKIRFADFSIIRLIQILGNYGNWRQVLQVIEWMQARERFKSNRIRNIYTAALDALGKARRPVEALNVFYTMQQQMPSYPDRVAYNCIAVTLGQAGHMRELFHVIDIMKSPPKKNLPTGVLQKWDPRLEPDIIVYNAVLNACVRQKNLEGAFWVLQQIKEQGHKPNSITYGLVMEVMLACEKYNLVHEFFKKMQKSFIPNSLTYKVLVNTLWKEGKVDEAILTVEEMEKRGIVGSAAVYYDLARCLCSAGRCEDALVQIEKVCKVASKPLVVTYTGLIQASLDSGKIDNGTYVFNVMHKFCSPNLVTYNIMLKGYLDHHKFEEAKHLFLKLLENGNHVASNVDSRQVVLPDIHSFNLMLDACLVNQRFDDLELFYTKMLQRGYHFNGKRHSHMILEACKAGKVNMLETTWKHLIKGDQIPPPPLVQEMFCMKLKEDDYSAGFSCLICLPSTESHKYSRKSWMNRFKDDPDLFRKETLLRVIDRVNTLLLRNQEPNVILLNLMKSCKETLGIL